MMLAKYRHWIILHIDRLCGPQAGDHRGGDAHSISAHSADASTVLIEHYFAILGDSLQGLPDQQRGLARTGR
jgi:hypothetical protein